MAMIQHLLFAQDYMFQAISAMEAGNLSGAMENFQKAGSSLKQCLSTQEAPSGPPAKTLSLEPLMISLCPVPISSPTVCSRSNGDESLQDASFLSPFAFAIHHLPANIAVGAAPTNFASEEQLAVCTAALLFNLGLCYQLKARYSSASDSLVAKAVKMYDKAWACSCRYQQQQQHQHSMSGAAVTLCLQMAISNNLGSCLFSLGHLQAAEQWLNCLAAVLEYYQDYLTASASLAGSMSNDDAVIPEEWLRFFYMTTVMRTKCLAAGAA